MRSGLTFVCDGATLAATIDRASGTTGLLIVTGGRQTRIGPHRLMAELGRTLSASGIPVLRFDRRGVGDSEGTDPGWRGSRPDIAAATAAFRAACPQLERVWGLGLCDAATALAIHGPAVGLDGLILLNPWVVEAEAGSPPPAAVRAYYRDRLLSLDGWRRLLTRGVSLKGLMKAASRTDQSLADDVKASLCATTIPRHALVAEQDATARAFLDLFPDNAVSGLHIARRNSASHSFAEPGDHAWLCDQLLTILKP